jgi:hypothetical protein
MYVVFILGKKGSFGTSMGPLMTSLTRSHSMWWTVTIIKECSATVLF